MPVADGDLVIRKSASDSFTLETYPHRPQVSARSHGAALRLARRYAKKTGVSIWFANSKGRFTEVKTTESSGAPAQSGADDEVGS